MNIFLEKSRIAVYVKDVIASEPGKGCIFMYLIAGFNLLRMSGVLISDFKVVVDDGKTVYFRRSFENS